MTENEETQDSAVDMPRIFTNQGNNTSKDPMMPAVSPMNEIHVEFWKFLWKLETGAGGPWTLLPKFILEAQGWQ